jgi:hypothetical protein
MRRYLTLLAAVGSLVWGTSALAGPNDVSVAVLGLEPIDVPEALAQSLTDALRQRASSTGGVRMVQGKDLIEVKMVFGCDGELPACMAQAGKTLGADKLLYGTVKKGASKTTVIVALKMLDVKTAVVERFVNDTVQKRELAGANAGTSAGKWFGQLLEVETKPTLTVTSDPSGAAVTVDGNGYGRTPVTLRDLSPGTHSVVLSMPGRQSVTRSVDLRAGGSHDVVATLEPEVVVVQKPPKPIEKPRPIEPQPLVEKPKPRLTLTPVEHPGRTAKIVAGVLVGAAVVTAVVAIVSYTIYHPLEQKAHDELTPLQPMMGQTQTAEEMAFFNSPGCTVPMSAAMRNQSVATQYHNDCTSGTNWANTATGLWVATGALAAGGVIAFVIGERQSAKAKEKQQTLGIIRQTLRVAPVFSTRGGGLTAAFEF